MMKEDRTPLIFLESDTRTLRCVARVPVRGGSERRFPFREPRLIAERPE